MNLENIKVLLFDFDDTLAIHTDYKTETEGDYYNRLLRLNAGVFNNCETSKSMRKIMSYCKKKGIMMGLISATTPISADLKITWIQQKYGHTLKNFCVDVPENKIHMMEAISETLRYEHDEIAIIDDYCETLESVSNAGFLAYSPMQAVNFAEKME